MSLIASEGSGKAFQLVSADTHAARCYRIIDLGTQKGEYQGKPKVARKILINWETAEIGEDGKPLIIGKKYTLSLGDKAALRKDLQAWRGRAFTEAELKGFDIANLLGATVLLNIVHETKDGKTYANIASIMPVPKGMPVPAPVNDRVLFSLNDFDQEVFDSLSDGLKNMIKVSPEYVEATTGAAPVEQSSGGSASLDDDDIPF